MPARRSTAESFPSANTTNGRSLELLVGGLGFIPGLRCSAHNIFRQSEARRELLHLHYHVLGTYAYACADAEPSGCRVQICKVLSRLLNSSRRCTGHIVTCLVAVEQNRESCAGHRACTSCRACTRVKTEFDMPGHAKSMDTPSLPTVTSMLLRPSTSRMKLGDENGFEILEAVAGLCGARGYLLRPQDFVLSRFGLPYVSLTFENRQERKLVQFSRNACLTLLSGPLAWSCPAGLVDCP